MDPIIAVQIEKLLDGGLPVQAYDALSRWIEADPSHADALVSCILIHAELRELHRQGQDNSA